MENRFLGHKQAVYDIQLDGLGGWFSAGSEGWIVHWPSGTESHGRLIAQTGEPIYSLRVLGSQSEFILAGGQSGTVYAFQKMSFPVLQNGLNHSNQDLQKSDGNDVSMVKNVRLTEELQSDNVNDDNVNLANGSSNELNSQMKIPVELKFEKMWEFRIHEKGVFDFYEYSEFQSKESRIIVSCSADGKLALWDINNPMKFLVKSNAIPGSLRCINSNFNLGNRVRVGGQSGLVYEWEILGDNWDNFEFQRIKEYTIGRNTLFQMVQHQNICALGGRDAKIWITDEFLNIYKQIDAHWFSIHALAFSPSGKLLASGSMDKCIRLWDVDGGDILVHKELAHKSSVNKIIWLDHETLISCSDDSQIISWKIKH